MNPRTKPTLHMATCMLELRAKRIPHHMAPNARDQMLELGWITELDAERKFYRPGKRHYFARRFELSELGGAALDEMATSDPETLAQAQRRIANGMDRGRVARVAFT